MKTQLIKSRNVVILSAIVLIGFSSCNSDPELMSLNNDNQVSKIY